MATESGVRGPPQLPIRGNSKSREALFETFERVTRVRETSFAKGLQLIIKDSVFQFRKLLPHRDDPGNHSSDAPSMPNAPLPPSLNMIARQIEPLKRIRDGSLMDFSLLFTWSRHLRKQQL